MPDYSIFLVNCVTCGSKTSRQYAKKNGGKCKACVTGQPKPSKGESAESRNARRIDSGHQAWAREEGHYDGPDY